MRRAAVSLKNQDLTFDQFKQKAFFDVEERPAYYRDRFGSMVSIPNKKTLVRADTGDYLSTVGNNFQPITNENYFKAVMETMGDANIQAVPKQVWVEDNGTTGMIVQMPQFQMFKGTSEEQIPEARFYNYFNAMGKAQTILGSVRIICTNGMTAFESDFRFHISHKGNIEQKIEDAVKLYMDVDNVYKRTEDMITRLGNTNGDKDKVAAYIGNGEITGQPMLTGERWTKKIQEEWQAANETVNLWLLYNLFTEIFSHRYGSNYSSKQRKQVQLNKEVVKWEKILL